MARRDSKLEQLRQARASLNAKTRPAATVDLDGLAERLLGGKLNPNQKRFIFSPERVLWYCGPAGCAKTSSLIASVIIPAMLYPGSRWFVARATGWTMRETTMKDFDEAIARLGPGIVVEDFAGPPRKVYIASAMRDENGLPAEPAEIIFHGLDEIGKLGSLQFTGVAVDEASEIDRHMATTLNTRLRQRKPGETGQPRGPFFLRMVSNPPSRNHWLHKAFCQEADCDKEPFGTKIQALPRENLHNLPEGYYESIAKGMSPEMRTRMVEGECGPDPGGNPVFGDFKSSLHVGELPFYPHLPLIRGWDFGRRRPACVWAQPTPEGHLNRLLCVLGENETTEAFARKVKYISAQKFHALTGGWRDVCDPHGTAKKSVSDKSDIDILREAGINPAWRDIGIQRGLDLLTTGFNTLVGGRPIAMYDRMGCSLLIEGYIGGYQWPKQREGAAAPEKPLADGIYEHVVDADRYIAVNQSMGSTVPLEHHATNLRRTRSTRPTGY